jgi:CheY-like chemotaxis protein
MKTILLVDDDKMMLDSLAQYAQEELRDYAVLKAKNGADAVEVLKNHPVDLVLTDLQMPVGDGYSVIEFKNVSLPDVPVIAMSADTSPDVMRKLSGLGVQECLEKPFSFDAACQLLQKRLSPHRIPLRNRAMDAACA